MNRVLHDDGIWNDKNGLGVGSAGLGGGASFLHRYLRMVDKDGSFPTMVSIPTTTIRMNDSHLQPLLTKLRHLMFWRT
jgi:hypothetical protein